MTLLSTPLPVAARHTRNTRHTRHARHASNALLAVMPDTPDTPVTHASPQVEFIEIFQSTRYKLLVGM